VRSTSRLVIRAAWVGEHGKLETWAPDDETKFAVFVTLAIGFSRSQGANEFSIRVATPLGLDELTPHGGVIATRPLLVVERYDHAALRRWLETTVTACEGGTWNDCVERLRRHFSWEYDGYD
jgi:hypothetical protein